MCLLFAGYLTLMTDARRGPDEAVCVLTCLTEDMSAEDIYINRCSEVKVRIIKKFERELCLGIYLVIMVEI